MFVLKLPIERFKTFYAGWGKTTSFYTLKHSMNQKLLFIYYSVEDTL